MERDAATSSTPLMPPTNAPVPYREFEPNGRGLAALTGPMKSEDELRAMILMELETEELEA